MCVYSIYTGNQYTFSATFLLIQHLVSEIHLTSSNGSANTLSDHFHDGSVSLRDLGC